MHIHTRAIACVFMSACVCLCRIKRKHDISKHINEHNSHIGNTCIVYNSVLTFEHIEMSDIVILGQSLKAGYRAKEMNSYII